MNYDFTYMRKIHKCIARNGEIVINRRRHDACIYFFDHGLQKLLHFPINYMLASELVALPFITLDSGNWETGDQSFRVDREVIRENGVKGINSSEIFSEVLKKYDVSYKPLNLKDFK